MKIAGKIKSIGNVVTKGKYQYKPLVIETLSKYPQTLCVQFKERNWGLLDAYNNGDSVDVGINISGREWTNPNTNDVVYLMSLVGWKLSRYVEEVTAQDHSPQREEEDDLPF